MADALANRLSRRERQIMDVLFRHGEGTVADVVAEMPDPPSYSAVRAMLRTLEDKGHVRHHEDGPRYVYRPTVARETARRSAIAHVVATFFDGSTEQAVAALLDGSERALTRDERARLTALIRQASEEGR
ncbi:MAG TPA: BlaI/MecI/CopY family transcriptional regulator [Gemmatimonadaceae bacterium]|jgi:predicted transcriptional regulator|nr:BlaI/MecI/CopY family transcriptional regulator [Gemmatimonadaceae bacterium]